MRETFKDKLARQIGLEDESRALGASRYRARRPLPWRHEPSSTDEEGDLPPGRQLLRLAIHPTADQMMPGVYDAVNAVQETAWKINAPILAIMREIWDGGGELGDLPARNPTPIPPRPADYAENEEAANRWKREASDIHDLNAKNVSKRLALSQRLWVATKFADEEEIYFPHSLDFRGRVYPLATGGPHPQGDDVAKGLLTLAGRSG